jgi:hypothetical protein
LQNGVTWGHFMQNIWNLFQIKDSLWSLINFFGRVEKGSSNLSQVLLWKDTVWMGMFGNQKKQGDWTQLFPMQKPITS